MGIVISIAIFVLLGVMLLFLIPGLTGAPYVPTLKDGLDQVFTKLCPTGKDDVVIDLGAGDGVVIKEITKTGAHAIGIEINPILSLIMKWRFRRNSRAKIYCRDFYTYKFPDNTTVVYAFAVATHIKSIQKKLQAEADRLGKKLLFVSNAFNFPDIKPKKKLSTFYLYEIRPGAK